MKARRIAVLGAGIMGSSAALLLARRGHQVDLFDAAAEPFSAASRWNEGKIHLGFIYSADPSLQTARRVLPGGLAFRPLLENLIGCRIGDCTTPTDDLFLCHRHSVVDADAMHGYLQAVAALVRQHPDAGQYLADASACRVERLTARELAAVTDSPDILAGFRVPERSVATNWVADRYVEALAAEPRIARHLGVHIASVARDDAVRSGESWHVESSHGRHGRYDYIINALWNGRMAVDATAGLPPAGKWSNRYRLSLFARTTTAVAAPSAIIATGPFGDIKNYNGRDFYLSWYPSGLMMDSSLVSPPEPPVLDEAAVREKTHSIFQRLTELLPQVGDIRQHIEQVSLRGGWVFAAGQGQLSDPRSTLHRRSDYGITAKGSFISVDTGKYAHAPLLAHALVEDFGL
ncbi:FAD-binding oxidoreductase [Betaproteobacteria bacterium SCN2]|jgi:glycine/D-amino acid oxidase-like deaminating enzyme|nr:FAD-binding oxidoreductase [Betaproteobacteria bacterium SCN2]